MNKENCALKLVDEIILIQQITIIRLLYFDGPTNHHLHKNTTWMMNLKTVIICSINCIAESMQVTEDRQYFRRRPRVGQP